MRERIRHIKRNKGFCSYFKSLIILSPEEKKAQIELMNTISYEELALHKGKFKHLDERFTNIELKINSIYKMLNA
jgi:hypothetical protein